ncbi:MAG: glycosyltransferase family 4 protein [Pseudonocardia sp.]
MTSPTSSPVRADTAERRCDWHVVVDSLAEDNASAVLNVARGLQRAAVDVGVPAYLAVGAEQTNGRADREGVLCPRPGGRARAVADAASKWLRGTSLGWREVADVSAACSRPTHVFLHNQPWLAGAFRRQLPDATIHLYAHNVLLSHVPRATVRRVLREIDGFVGVSRFVADDFAARTGIEPERLHVVHNAVDADAFIAPGSAAEAHTDVVFLGRMVPEKGAHVLVDALTVLDRRGIRLRARIAGAQRFAEPGRSGAYERALRRTVADRGLDVEFVGCLPPRDVPRFMNGARIVVVPSVWREPLGLVALEALASEAALICTRSGGMPEIVGTGALLVDPGDATALAGAIARLHTDEHHRGALAARGRAEARIRTWARAYDELLKIGARPGQPA